MPKASHWLALALLTPLAAAPPDREVPAGATTQALQYPFTDGTTLIGFQGTALAPGASGQASIRGEGGRMKVHAHFRELGPANRFGPEFLTYVLWAISPTGRPVNLGEVVVSRGRAHVEAMTGLASFGLIVSAEPHFAVTRVSHAVVLENQPLRGVRPPVAAAEVRFDRLDRGAYLLEPGTAPPSADHRISPYVHQARNAMRIARLEGVDTLAPAAFQRAAHHLEHMEQEKELWRRPAVLLARRTILQAEEARLLADRQREADALTEARERTREAQTQAEAARQEAEAARHEVEAARAAAHRQERAATEASRKATEAQLAVRRELLERLNRLLQTKETEEGLMATLTDVAFPSGRDQLNAAARVNLAKVAGLLLPHAGLKLRVLGHADATGRPAFNERLSLRRAEAVRWFLVQQGLPPLDIACAGQGSAHPVAPNTTPEGRQANRRVEIIVHGEPIGL